MLFNILERKFIVFGLHFTPQDFHLFVFAMLTFLVFIVLFTVVYGLYEISIFLVRRVEKEREKKLRAEGLWFDDEDEDDDPLAEEFEDELAAAQTKDEEKP